MYFFCYNSLSGDYAILTEKNFKWLKNFIKNNNFKNKANQNLIKELIRYNILVRKRGTEERINIIKKNDKYTNNLLKQENLNFLGFCVTDRCNFDCSYCIKRKCDSFFKKKKNDLKWEKAKKRLDEFLDIVSENKHKIIVMGFGGGEHLLQFKLIKKIVIYTKKNLNKNKKIKFSITTNGSLINKEIADFFSKNNFEVSVSLDGFSRIHNINRKYLDNSNTFEGVIKGLKILLEKIDNKKISISAVIASNNVEKINVRFLNLIQKLEIKKFFLEPDIINLVHYNRLKLLRKIIHFYKYGKKIGIEVNGHWSKPFKNFFRNSRIAACAPFAGTSITVDATGKIYPCIYLKEYGLSGPLSNIFYRKKYLNKIQANWIGNIKECKDCNIEGVCLGGCRISRIFDNKVFKYRCFLFKKMTNFLIKDFLKSNY